MSLLRGQELCDASVGGPGGEMRVVEWHTVAVLRDERPDAIAACPRDSDQRDPGPGQASVFLLSGDFGQPLLFPFLPLHATRIRALPAEDFLHRRRRPHLMASFACLCPASTPSLVVSPSERIFLPAFKLRYASPATLREGLDQDALVHNAYATCTTAGDHHRPHDSMHTISFAA